MSEDDLVTNDDSLPVSDHLEDFDLPDFETEIQVWKTRCHELWNDSRSAGDLRAQAQAIGAAIRSLENWARSLESQQKTVQHSLSEDAKAEIIREDTDRIVKLVDAINAREGMVACPACHGLGRCPRPVAKLVIAHFGKGGTFYQEYRVASGLEEADGHAAN